MGAKSNACKNTARGRKHHPPRGRVVPRLPPSRFALRRDRVFATDRAVGLAEAGKAGSMQRRAAHKPGPSFEVAATCSRPEGPCAIRDDRIPCGLVEGRPLPRPRDPRSLPPCHARTGRRRSLHDSHVTYDVAASPVGGIRPYLTGIEAGPFAPQQNAKVRYPFRRRPSRFRPIPVSSSRGINPSRRGTVRRGRRHWCRQLP
jgi:hypothetical protein